MDLNPTELHPQSTSILIERVSESRKLLETRFLAFLMSWKASEGSSARSKDPCHFQDLPDTVLAPSKAAQSLKTVSTEHLEFSGSITVSVRGF